MRTHAFGEGVWVIDLEFFVFFHFKSGMGHYLGLCCCTACSLTESSEKALAACNTLRGAGYADLTGPLCSGDAQTVG